MGAYFPDRTTIIVVAAEHRGAANQLAQDATRNPDGTPTTTLGTFASPLQAAGQDPVAGVTTHYWTNWAMTQSHRDFLLAELGNRFKRTVTPIPLGTKPKPNEPFYVFDAEPGQWTDKDVFTALSLEPVPVPD